MGFFGSLFGIGKKSDSYSAEVDRCRVMCEMTISEIQMAELNYHRGYNCYKAFVKYVFFYNETKIKKIFEDGKKMADRGCAIDFTFVRFFHSDKYFLDIPFEVFASKVDMPDEQLRRKLWHKANIERILINNPKLN